MHQRRAECVMQRAKSDPLFRQFADVQDHAWATFGLPSDHQERISLCEVDVIGRVGILFKPDQGKRPLGLSKILRDAAEMFASHN